MKTNLFSFLTVLSISLIISGCATMSDVIKDKDKGTSAQYNVSAEQAWDIAITVLRWERCETIEQHKNQNYMLTTVGRDFVSEGSLVGVWVEPVTSQSTKVTVVTKRKVSTNLATGLTETAFQRRFAQAVDIVKSGGTLPIEPPSIN